MLTLLICAVALMFGICIGFVCGLYVMAPALTRDDLDDDIDIY